VIAEVLAHASGAGFAEMMSRHGALSPSGDEYTSAHEYRQRYLIASLRRLG
jgi:hypothetical protein